MSSVKSVSVPAVFRKKSEKKRGKCVPQKTTSTKGVLYQDCLTDIIRGVPQNGTGKYPHREMQVSPEELNELRIFDTFISSHVKPNKICDIPCMLLWAEWVRFCLKDTHTFPKAILEKECRDLVIHSFGFDVAEDEVWGPVYPGIQYVSQKTIPLNIIDRVPANA